MFNRNTWTSLALILAFRAVCAARSRGSARGDRRLSPRRRRCRRDLRRLCRQIGGLTSALACSVWRVSAQALYGRRMEWANPKLAIARTAIMPTHSDML